MSAEVTDSLSTTVNNTNRDVVLSYGCHTKLEFTHIINRGNNITECCWWTEALSLTWMLCKSINY